MKKISVIGSGGWGTAISIILSNKGNKVNLWSYKNEEAEDIAKYRENKAFLPNVTIPNEIFCTNDLEKCVKESDVLIFATPSYAIRNTAKEVKKFYSKEKVIINISKGLEEGTELRLSEVIFQEIENANLAVMSGPSHAEEVARNIPTTNVVASNSKKTAQFVQDLFMTPKFRVYTNSDVIGVEIGGSLKNVIALCAGITDGLGFGDNTKAALMTRGLAEISRLGVSLGAKKQTFSGLTGIGDLIVTCTSMHSRNRRAGILIGQGKTLDQALIEIKMVVEGVKTTSAAYILSKKQNVEMPIVCEAYEVLFKNKSPMQAVKDLMMRSKKHETEDIFDDIIRWK